MLELGKCDFCIHCNNEDYSCKAFPNGIPTSVYWDWSAGECNNTISFEDKDSNNISRYDVPVDTEIYIIGNMIEGRPKTGLRTRFKVADHDGILE